MPLAVLMYHKIRPVALPDSLTISVEKFSEQLQYLYTKGFNSISLSQLTAYIKQGTPLPPKPVLISFDDGYRDNLLYAYPLLKKYSMKANIFLIGDKVGLPQKTAGEYLDTADLQSMDTSLVEFGFHSFAHGNYGAMALTDIEADITAMQNRFKQIGIKCQPCFAYPYGAFGRASKDQQKSIEHIFQKMGIHLAFRIGNRINKLPVKQKYLIQRIDIKGNEMLWQFKIICKLGRKWLP